MTSQKFWLALSDFGETVFKGFGDAGVKRASRLAQQRAVGRVLNEGVLEQIGCVWWHALPEQQTCHSETVQRRA